MAQDDDGQNEGREGVHQPNVERTGVAKISETDRQYQEEGAGDTNGKTKPKQKRAVRLQAKWNQTSLPNKLNIALTAIICGATITNVLILRRQVADQDRQVDQITTAIRNGIDKTKTAIDSSLLQSNDALRAILEQNRAALDASREQNKESLKATLSQGQRALDASTEASRNDQRAWVGVVGVNTEGGIADKDSFTANFVQIVLRNSGKTPALKMSGQCCMIITRIWRDPIPDYDSAVREQEEAERKSRQKMTDDITRQNPQMATRIIESMKESDALRATAMKSVFHEGDVLAPDVPRGLSILPSIKWSTRIPDKTFPESSLPATIYILGKITYYDIFPGTPQRTSKFCLMRTNGTAFGICPEGNWMD